MQKRACMIIASIVLIVFCCFATLTYKRFDSEKATRISLLFPEPLDTYVYETNIKQIYRNNSIWIETRDRKLYYYCAMSKLKNDHCLCIYQDGKTSILRKFDSSAHVNMMGMHCGFIYYWIYKDYEPGNDVLYCYNTQTGSESMLYKGYAARCRLSSINKYELRVPVENDEEIEYLCLSNGSINQITGNVPYYSIKGKKYYAIDKKHYTVTEKNTSGESPSTEHIFFCDENKREEEIELSAATTRILMKCGEGLIIQNDGYNDIIYYINPEGNMELVMHIDGMSTRSSVAIADNEVYVSIKRYEDWGEYKLGKVRYKNDQIEGTYRISPPYCEAKKISNQVFETMYVYDAKHILGVDEELRVWFIDLENFESKEMLF